MTPSLLHLFRETGPIYETAHFEEALNGLEEQLETLREFFDAFEEVEGGIVDFDLHNEAVMRMRAAREAVYAMVSSP